MFEGPTPEELENIGAMITNLEKWTFRPDQDDGPQAEQYRLLVDGTEAIALDSLYEEGLELDASQTALVLYLLLSMQSVTAQLVDAEPATAMGVGLSAAMRGVMKATLTQFAQRAFNGCEYCEETLTAVEAALGKRCLTCAERHDVTHIEDY